jgi:hypothetical protein
MKFPVFSVKRVFGGFEVIYWVTKYQQNKRVQVKEKSFYDIKSVWLGVPSDQLQRINFMQANKADKVIIGNTQYVEKSVVYLGEQLDRK